jgi:ribosomal protein L11 methyltransferase
MSGLEQWTRICVILPERLGDIVADFFVSRLGRGIEVAGGPDDRSEPYVSVIAYISSDDNDSPCVVEKDLRSMFSESDAALIELSSESFEDDDWKERWKDYFHPVRIGNRVVVRPSWHEFEAGPGDVVIEIDPGQAFGVGTHASTALMLMAVERLFRTHGFSSVLDIGTGTGILAIAAAKFGAGSVTAIDIDLESEKAAKRNAFLNDVADSIMVSTVPVSSLDNEYGLVLANIDRDTLLGLARDIARVVEVDGFLVVSGILDVQADDVFKCYSELGFVRESFMRHDKDREWVAMIFRRYDGR